MTANLLLEIRALNKKIGKKKILRDLQLNLYQGDIFGFLGPNGAGKTTLVKIILDLMHPTAGKIKLNCPKSKIGYLPEYPYFYEYLTGYELLIFTGKVFHLPPNLIQNKIDVLSQKLNLKTSDLKRKIKTYSKGMKQRLGFIQALINDPDLLFLDEPFSGLDPLGRKTIRDLILKLKAQGKTIFFNSHILSDIEDLCDRIAIINQGQLLLTEQVQTVQKENASLEEFFIEQVTKNQ